MYSVPKFVLVFFLFPVPDLKISVGKHERHKPNSAFSMQWEKFSEINFVKNQIRFCRNTAYSTNYTIWLHLIMKRLIIPDNELMYFLTLPVLHSCFTLFPNEHWDLKRDGRKPLIINENKQFVYDLSLTIHKIVFLKWQISNSVTKNKV